MPAARMQGSGNFSSNWKVPDNRSPALQSQTWGSVGNLAGAAERVNAKPPVYVNCKTIRSICWFWPYYQHFRG